MLSKQSLVMPSLLAIILLACGEDSSNNSNVSVREGTVTDSRDGKTYKTVTIGSQTWMAENLNYNDGTTSSHCYRDDEINCFRYGRLYIGPRDMDCPDGWHIPRLEEWETLISAVGGDSVA